MKGKSLILVGTLPKRTGSGCHTILVGLSVGIGHSGEILRLKIAPDGEHLVSVSADGSILRWKIPPLPQNVPKENGKAVSPPLAQSPDDQQPPEGKQPSESPPQQPHENQQQPENEQHPTENRLPPPESE